MDQSWNQRKQIEQNKFDKSGELSGIIKYILQVLIS